MCKCRNCVLFKNVRTMMRDLKDIKRSLRIQEEDDSGGCSRDRRKQKRMKDLDILEMWKLAAEKSPIPDEHPALISPSSPPSKQSDKYVEVSVEPISLTDESPPEITAWKEIELDEPCVTCGWFEQSRTVQRKKNKRPVRRCNFHGRDKSATPSTTLAKPPLPEQNCSVHCGDFVGASAELLRSLGRVEAGQSISLSGWQCDFECDGREGCGVVCAEGLLLPSAGFYLVQCTVDVQGAGKHASSAKLLLLVDGKVVASDSRMIPTHGAVSLSSTHFVPLCRGQLISAQIAASAEAMLHSEGSTLQLVRIQ